MQPSYIFTAKEHRGPFEFSDELGNMSISAESVDAVVQAQNVEANDKDLLLSTAEKEDGRDLGSNGSAYSAPSYSGSSGLVATSQSHGELRKGYFRTRRRRTCVLHQRSPNRPGG